MEARRLERDVAFQTPTSIIIAYISSSLEKSQSVACRRKGTSFVGTEGYTILGSPFKKLNAKIRKQNQA